VPGPVRARAVAATIGGDGEARRQRHVPGSVPGWGEHTGYHLRHRVEPPRHVQRFQPELVPPRFGGSARSAAPAVPTTARPRRSRGRRRTSGSALTGEAAAQLLYSCGYPKSSDTFALPAHVMDGRSIHLRDFRTEVGSRRRQATRIRVAPTATSKALSHTSLIC
jgi:hypothetical protein